MATVMAEPVESRPVGTWLERVRAMGAEIDAAASAHETDNELDPQVVRMMDEAGVFSMMPLCRKPHVSGGVALNLSKRVNASP